MATLDITKIPAPRVPLIDENTGLMAREWYRFFYNLFVLAGSGGNQITLDDLQVGPPSQQDFTEILRQVNTNIAPQYEDQSGDFLKTLDTAQLMSMMARFENLESAIQGAYLQPPQPSVVGGDVAGPSSSTDNAVARFDGTTGKLIQNSVTTIDDTGNASGILSQQFSNGTAVTLAAGKFWYDGTDGSWNAGMGGGNITQQIGEEIFVYGKASAAITDSPLQIVYKTGVVGASGVVKFAPAAAGITDADQILGIATESLALNAFGRVTNFGIVHGITTNGTAFGEVWADNDDIWYNPTTGNPTKTKPSAPGLKVQIGTVINAGSGGSGSFFVKIGSSSSLGGTDANVQFGTLANNNLIAYDSTAGYWKNVTASSIGLGTVSSVSVVSANGLAGTVATATTTPAITLSTTITGLLKGNGTAISAATSGTDYAPATSGTSILYGNGSGGFSNVTIGTGVTFSAGTLSATGSGGTVTSVAALTLGTTGTDLSSTVANGTTTPVITLQVPTASAVNRGALSAADWTTFNNKGSGTVTSVAQSFTGGLISVAGSPITTSGTLALTVAGTSGGIPYFSSASTWATSAALAASALVVGGGAGAAPATTTTGTGVVTALGVNTGTAGAFVVNGGALGTPSSGTVTNLTGTAGINTNGAHNGTVGATTANTGAFTTLSATGLTSLGAATGFSRLLLGNAAPSGNNEAYIDFISSNSLYNWRISSNLYAASWQLTPSTAAGGSTFTTPLLSVSSAGIVTMSAYGAGAATFSAAGVISSVSDETWKIKDGTPVDPNAMLKKLEPGYWYYNDEKKETFGKDRQLGFYAQNVNAAIGPEAAPEPESYISQDKDGNEITVKKPWGYYDRSVLAVTVMSLQKALATIEALTARIAALEAK